MKGHTTSYLSHSVPVSFKLPETSQFSTRWGTVLMAVLLITVVILAGAGLFLAGMEIFGTHDTGPGQNLAGVGKQISTSFGSLSVNQVDNLSGLTSQALGGVTHGIQNLVLIGKTQVIVSVMLTNRLSVPYRVEPSRFHLKTDASLQDIPLIGATIRPGQLVPGASIEATFTFVVPSNGSKIWLEFQDQAAAPIKIALGWVDHPSQEEIDDGQHGH